MTAVEISDYIRDNFLALSEGDRKIYTLLLEMVQNIDVVMSNYEVDTPVYNLWVEVCGTGVAGDYKIVPGAETLYYNGLNDFYNYLKTTPA